MVLTEKCGDCGTETELAKLAPSIDGKAKICPACLKVETEREIMYDDALRQAYDRCQERG